MSSDSNGVTHYVYVPSSRERRGQTNEKETSVRVKILECSPNVNEEEDDFSDIPSKKTKLNDGEEANASSSNYCNSFVVGDNGECVNDEGDSYSARSCRVKRTSQDAEKRQPKCKLFRDEWLTIDIFRDWLDRDPDNPRKARCLACNTTMNAGKSELEKHAAGARHERALDAMLQEITIQQLTSATVNGDDGSREPEPGEEDESLTGSSNFGNPDSDGDPAQSVVIEQAVNPVEALEQPEILEFPVPGVYGEALNRMAQAVEGLANNVNLLLERLTAQQDSYLQFAKFLQEKHSS